MRNLIVRKVSKSEELFRLSEGQKKSIAISRKQIAEGKYKNHDEVMNELKRWLRSLAKWTVG